MIVPDHTTYPTTQNLTRAWDGQVTLDANHDLGNQLSGPLGITLPTTHGTWIWVSNTSPDLARTATTAEMALEELLADHLTEYPTRSVTAWDRINNGEAA